MNPHNHNRLWQLVSNEMGAAQEAPLYISENESVKDDLLIF